MRHLVDSAAHLGQFFLLERTAAGGRKEVFLEGPDGRLFRPSESLPVLSRSGELVQLTGSDVVLCWLVDPRRQREEIEMGLRFLAQWPEGPQASLSCW